MFTTISFHLLHLEKQCFTLILCPIQFYLLLLIVLNIVLFNLIQFVSPVRVPFFFTYLSTFSLRTIVPFFTWNTLSIPFLVLFSGLPNKASFQNTLNSHNHQRIFYDGLQRNAMCFDGKKICQTNSGFNQCHT